MYRFVLRPAWIASHLLIVALLVAMVNLGLWQLRRLDEKRALNDTVAERTAQAPVAVEGLLSQDPDSVDFSPVSAVGEYDAAHEFVILSRSLGGAPGRWMVTPLRTNNGYLVYVMRGFAPSAIDDTEPPIDGVAPPSGQVRVAGWLRRSENRDNKSPLIDPNQYQLLDAERISQETQSAAASMWIQLYNQDPQTDSQLLTPVPLPEKTEGPHLSYAIQWFIFTAIAAIGYPLVLRKVARQRSLEART